MLMNNTTQELSTPKEILKAPLEKEQAAYRFYDDLLKNTKITLLEEVLEMLREEEAKHIRITEKKITDMDLGVG
jgi:rubrerythrin